MGVIIVGTQDTGEGHACASGCCAVRAALDMVVTIEVEGFSEAEGDRNSSNGTNNQGQQDPTSRHNRQDRQCSKGVNIKHPI